MQNDLCQNADHVLELTVRNASNMPVHRARGPRGGKGYQYGESGRVYPTRAQAIKQMVAIKISQGKIKPKKKR